MGAIIIVFMYFRLLENGYTFFKDANLICTYIFLIIGGGVGALWVGVTVYDGTELK